MKSKFSSILVLMTIGMAFVDGMLFANQLQSKQAAVEVLAGKPLENSWTAHVSGLGPVAQADTKPTSPKAPFIFQTPFGLWEKPWDSFAEEAIIAMVRHGLNSQELSTRDLIAAELLSIWQEVKDALGNKPELSIPEIQAILAKSELAPSMTLLKDPSAIALTDALQAGSWVIVPVNGQAMQNPYYGKPGPRHHVMLLIDANTEDETFTANDPGTRRGNGVVYAQEKILQSLEDLDGSKQVLIVNP